MHAFACEDVPIGRKRASEALERELQEPPDVGSGNRIPVLCKSGNCPTLRSHLSSANLTFFVCIIREESESSRTSFSSTIYGLFSPFLTNFQWCLYCFRFRRAPWWWGTVVATAAGCVGNRPSVLLSSKEVLLFVVFLSHKHQKS